MQCALRWLGLHDTTPESILELLKLLILAQASQDAL